MKQAAAVTAAMTFRNVHQYANPTLLQLKRMRNSEFNEGTEPNDMRIAKSPVSNIVHTQMLDDSMYPNRNKLHPPSFSQSPAFCCSVGGNLNYRNLPRKVRNFLFICVL